MREETGRGAEGNPVLVGEKRNVTTLDIITDPLLWCGREVCHHFRLFSRIVRGLWRGYWTAELSICVKDTVLSEGQV